MLDQLYRTAWQVYAKPPFAGPEAVVKYLGRYTHRIAISNARLLSLNDTHVRFSYTDYADKGRTKVLSLTIGEFIRRFLLHVIPPNFVRIRYYGFLSCRSRRTKLALCRAQLTEQSAADTEAAENAEHHPEEAAPRHQHRCPHCGIGRMLRVGRIDKPYPGGACADAA